MKKMKLTAMVTLILLGIGGAAAQSLGDYARAVRKNKTEPATASRHFDNDNLPTDQALSVVGPPPDASAASAATPAAPATNAPAAAEKQKTADEWKNKLDQQKAKIDALSHELELEQREYRLKAAAFYGDAGTRLRDAAQWDKQDTDYKSEVESKQKAIDAARQQLEDLQEQARKAGVAEKDKDKDKDDDKGTTKK